MMSPVKMAICIVEKSCCCCRPRPLLVSLTSSALVLDIFSGNLVLVRGETNTQRSRSGVPEESSAYLASAPSYSVIFC